MPKQPNNKWTLTELREHHVPKLSQRGLAQELELPESTVAMYDSGNRTPSLKRALLVADYFGIAIENIFFGHDAHETRANPVPEPKEEAHK